MFWSLKVTGEKPLFIVKNKNFAIFDSVEEIILVAKRVNLLLFMR